MKFRRAVEPEVCFGRAFTSYRSVAIFADRTFPFPLVKDEFLPFTAPFVVPPRF